MCRKTYTLFCNQYCDSLMPPENRPFLTHLKMPYFEANWSKIKRGSKLYPNMLHFKFEGSTKLRSPKNAKTTFLFQIGPILAMLTQIGPKTIGFLRWAKSTLCVNLMNFHQICHPISRRQECDGHTDARMDGRTHGKSDHYMARPPTASHNEVSVTFTHDG